MRFHQSYTNGRTLTSLCDPDLAALACSCDEPCLEAYLALNQNYASNSTKLITEKAKLDFVSVRAVIVLQGLRLGLMSMLPKLHYFTNFFTFKAQHRS